MADLKSGKRDFFRSVAICTVFPNTFYYIPCNIENMPLQIILTFDKALYKQVVLEPRVSPEHTSKYVDTVIVFAKT